jgi:hypothetical protein
MCAGKSSKTRLLPGDWIVMLCGLVCVVLAFKAFWNNEDAGRLVIRQDGKIFASYTLNQDRTLNIHGPMGDSIVQIAHGKARFSRSPCTNQYCVHQGWLNKVGEAAICLPNRISLELMGKQKPYDSLNY